MHGSGLDLALVFLLAAVVAAPLFRRLGLGAVLGYLAAGVLLGPQGLRVVADADPVLAASEVGVVMMLFVLGLELSPSRLMVMRRPVFGAGGAQMLLCSLALGTVARLAGLSWTASIVVGIALALSSTAVGLQLLSERRAVHSEHGRLAFAILLFQDLAAIPLLALMPLLGHVGGTAFDGYMVGKALGAVLLVVVGGRLLLRQAFRLIARTGMPEVFTGAALLTVLGAAWIMLQAGLSPGLGAFLAGVLLADSEFRHELEAQIDPFKGLLLGLFFMAVGMTIDVARVVAEPLRMAALVGAMLAIKFVLLVIVGRRPGRLSGREAVQLAGVLALGGEFAFVVFSEATRVGLIDALTRDRLVATVGLSMAVGPLLMLVVVRLIGRAPAKPARAFDTIPDHQPKVLVAGFGRFGQVVARLLAAQKLPFIAIEPSADQVDFVRRFGNPVYYGDPSRSDLLRSAGAESVKVFVIALEDPEASVRTTRAVRQLYPDAAVYASARDRRHAWELMDLGAQAIRETFYSSLYTGERVLVDLGFDPTTVHAQVKRFREHDERLLRAQYEVRDDEAALIQTSREARRELEDLFNADVGEGVLGTMVREAETP
ncbi:glutathione-regulated potassium-efflux system protein KefB [Lysobacter sp. TY2-98]|uniref:monovalent cation:proton antiporter-2 (CPA2) family protein n=1 Tax=Lysobacter sp. TY2-98 TaxID=2290922 RepID=UPI000E201F08|nr:monovalent cation:proton antiporter-2 (CPA2) family protein [Lysobacter sp. TY2-98]AXK73355.1 glutathione-regulated potassium-efflux system protein KefB [Lysobacter sp. TY2-98]